MKDVMVDLEAGGTAPGCPLLTIGAVRFSLDTHTLAGVTDPWEQLDEADRLYLRVEQEDCRKLGLTWDPDTWYWWSTQDPLVRDEALFGQPRLPMLEALCAFRTWFGSSTYIWGHGSTFDVTLLEDAFRRVGLDAPWRFWNVRDTRTLYDLAGEGPRRGEGHHNALVDALAQAEAAQRAYQALKGGV